MNDEQQILANIVQGFLSGDTEQYRTIRSRIAQYVHLQYFGDAINKEDIVSDVVEILLRNLRDGKFHGETLKGLEVYMFGIVKNTVLNRRRKSGRLVFISTVPDQTDKAAPVDDTIAREDLSRRILEAMDEKCRELLELKFRQFWSDQEIADRQKKSKNAVSTAISRCLKKARALGFLDD